MSGLHLDPLREGHSVEGFRSGSAELDSWLVAHALAAQLMDSVRTFLLLQDDQVIGYFSLTMGSVRRDDAPPALVRGLPGCPGGMVLLARLAVDHRQQGRGLGSALLAEALRKSLVAGETAAARLVVVDAIDGAAERFYLHHGFIPAPEHPHRLYRRMKDIRASFDAAGRT